MAVRVNIDRNWSDKVSSGMGRALLEMSVDIQRRAVILAPILTGALKNSGQISPVPDGYKISFGSSRVPYARRQHFEHRTKSGYLAKAGDSVARGDKSKYFRGKV